MGLAEHLIASLALGFAARCATHAAGAPVVPKRADPAGLPALSIVVAARNEERGIEAAIRSLGAQTHADYEVIVVDDRSTDATRAVLQRLEAEYACLRVVDGEPLPEGWAGKPWALEQGVRIARGAWLLFTDADVLHAPEAATSALRFALERRVDALSLLWDLEMETFAERAVLPSILASILVATGPVSAINDPSRPGRAAATGAFILVRRGAFEALGGHARLRGAVVEDIEFARLVKSDGRFRFMLAEGRELVRLRMYHSLREIWTGFTKNVYFATHGSLVSSLGGAVVLSAISWVPPVLALRAAVRRRPLDLLESLLVTALLVATSAWGMGARGLDRRLGLGAPLGLALLAGITLNSTLRVRSGSGVNWRGRRYHRG